MYAGLAILFFFLILFLQQIAGYSPLKSGLTTLPVTVVMFLLSRRFGALADRFGPRFFMGAGPLVGACGLLLFQRVGTNVDYLTELLPALLVFSRGPLDDGRAAHRGGARGRHEGGRGDRLRGEQRDRARGRADGHRRGWRRGGGLLRRQPRQSSGGRAARALPRAPPWRRPSGCRSAGRTCRGCRHARPTPSARPLKPASLHSFHVGMAIAAVLLAVGGVIGVIGIRNPGGIVTAEHCPAGQLVGTGRELAEQASA